jgi:predicted metal-dependent phosphoesterase TrpH
MLIDLHTHTRVYSSDAILNPDELIELSKNARLDGICLSEHDAFWDFDAVRTLSKRHEFLVLPAIEVSTDHGHMLCFGLGQYTLTPGVWSSRRFSGNVDALELRQDVERAEGAMIAAHPYRRFMYAGLQGDEGYYASLERARRNPAFARCHGLERINGRASAKENSFSGNLCDLMGLPGSGGTDSHDPLDVGRCATKFDRRIDGLDDLIVELRAGRFRALRLARDEGQTALGAHTEEAAK